MSHGFAILVMLSGCMNPITIFYYKSILFINKPVNRSELFAQGIIMVLFILYLYIFAKCKPG